MADTTKAQDCSLAYTVKLPACLRASQPSVQSAHPATLPQPANAALFTVRQA